MSTKSESHLSRTFNRGFDRINGDRSISNNHKKVSTNSELIFRWPLPSATHSIPSVTTTVAPPLLLGTSRTGAIDSSRVSANVSNSPSLKKQILASPYALTSDPQLFCTKPTESAFISHTRSLMSLPGLAHCKLVTVLTGHVSVLGISTVPAFVSEEKPSKRWHTLVSLRSCNLDCSSKQRKLMKIRTILPANSLIFDGRPIPEAGVCLYQIWTGIFRKMKKIILFECTKFHWSNTFCFVIRKHVWNKIRDKLTLSTYSSIAPVSLEINSPVPVITAIQTTQNLQAERVI